MSAAGHDIWDNADDFRFAHKTLTGNGSIVVKVESLVNTNGWAKAGVMIRQSLDADSKFVYFIVSFGRASPWAGGRWRRATCGSVTHGGHRGSAVGQAHPHGRCLHGPVLRRRQDLDRSEERRRHDRLDDGGHDRPGVRRSVRDQPQCRRDHDRGDVRGQRPRAPSAAPGRWRRSGTIRSRPTTRRTLYVTVQDSAGKTATAINPTAVVSAEWTQWKIPLSSFAGVNRQASRS